MNQRILIVEDEPAIVDNIRYVLESEGFTIICHEVGKDVISFLDSNHADLIILDIGLPDINGMELCKDIRKKHLIPIIFLTARSDEIDRVVGLEIGADDYVTKPFSPRELAARVKAILRRTETFRHFPAAENPGQTAGSPFNVDEIRCRITCFSKIVDLSRYEYLLLKTFIKKPGRVFSRDILMDMVWDEPESSMDRTVDAHIKNIRAKLKKIKSGFDPIVTHRGMGYSFKEYL
ncbi:two-component system response regulator CreB [Desulfobacterales bacterium HSG16]|nr:two-component system response regulator CreB [Desulfobacterales bacterium HSG16]